MFAAFDFLKSPGQWFIPSLELTLTKFGRYLWEPIKWLQKNYLKEVIYATYAVKKRKPEKKSGLHGIRTLDLCDTGAALYQLS